jgi:hypothetical protein
MVLRSPRIRKAPSATNQLARPARFWHGKTHVCVPNLRASGIASNLVSAAAFLAASAAARASATLRITSARLRSYSSFTSGEGVWAVAVGSASDMAAVACCCCGCSVTNLVQRGLVSKGRCASEQAGRQSGGKKPTGLDWRSHLWCIACMAVRWWRACQPDHWLLQ